MRHLSRVVGILGLAVSVAACSTAEQGSGGLGQSADQTIRDHPQTAVGAGVGAAGGAVVGGLAGGTKGAVIGGLLGALAGGVIGNYVERREAAVPQSTTVSTPATPAGTSVSVPGAAVPSNVAAMVRVDQVQTQPSTVRPGDTVSLNATYTILSPSDQLVTVRETREVRLNGELVANPAVDVARQTGTYSSALPIGLPTNARSGRYEVTMTVASGNRQSTSTTSFSVQ